MKLSVVMPHHKRTPHLEKTLRQYVALHSGSEIFKETEFIIVDGSGGQNTEFLAMIDRMKPFMNLKALFVEEKRKGIVLAMNIGIRQACGEFVVLQHSECVPMTENVLDEIYKGMTPETYLSCACYSMTQGATLDFFAGKNPILESHMAIGDGSAGWYNHSVYNPRHLHFFICVPRRALLNIGGYDEDYAEKAGYDDDDIRDRLVAHGLTITPRDDLFCLHLWHQDGKMWQTPEARMSGYHLYQANKEKGASIERNVGIEWGKPDGRVYER